jgi:hypothetical protein
MDITTTKGTVKTILALTGMYIVTYIVSAFIGWFVGKKIFGP